MELKDKKIVIATHVYTTGPSQDMRDYLVDKDINKVMFIGHPLFFDKKLNGSGYEFYEKGELIKERYTAIKKRPALWNYVKDVFLTVLWVARSNEDWDLFVGSDNLNAFAGVILKKLRKVKKVVYYVIDYDPERFSNKVMNRIYHFIDQLCVLRADETWNLSPRMAWGREEYFGFHGGTQITVPIGIWFSRIKRAELGAIDRFRLAFMGHILEKQGVQYVLEAVPLIKKEIPQFTFLVIGGGDHLDALKKKAGNMGLDGEVIFTGYVKRHEDIEKMLGECAAAVAFYQKTDSSGKLNFSYFADPGKLKSYLACGLPVIISDVPHNAREIEDRRCGFITGYDKEEIARVVINLMKDADTLEKYRQNAIEYAKEFDWERIFQRNLSRVLIR